MRRPRLRLVVAVGWLLGVALGAGTAAAEGAALRPFTVEDSLRLGLVEDPRVSPDGRWVAYTVTTPDLEKDEAVSRIWMVPASGGDPVPVTSAERSASKPRWSPDGRYLSFLAAPRDGEDQVWTLFREGGEAVQLTDTAQAVKDYAWSPDGTRVVVVLQDPSPEQLAAKRGEEKPKSAPPWVITRRQFKLDYVGYLDRRRTHLYVVDLATRAMTQITFGDWDDAEPAWSPDGAAIAFTSNRTADPDSNYNTDIWLVAADTAGPVEAPRRVTTNPGADAAPAFSPDGRLIAHLATCDVEAIVYATSHLAVVPAGGGPATVLTSSLDRNAFWPRFSRDGGSVLAAIEDDGEQYLAAVPVTGGPIERVIGGPRAVRGFDVGPAGRIAAVISEPQLPAEVFVVGQGRLARLTHTNDAVLDGIRLGEVENVGFPSADGTEIEGFSVTPPGFVRGTPHPALLLIHGGPMMQYDFGFDPEPQIFAGAGYVVIMANPRGSSGYGQSFSTAIWRAWGERDLEDVMAAVDDAIARGYADPARLAVGGWSYGGMLTDHVITRTDRFRAAYTGASSALYIVNFGHDEYQLWWEGELGLPWQNPDLYHKLSPYFRVDRVVTPTLIMGGEQDWNVPIVNSEQLFQALKRLGVPTELVVYPGEFHVIATPSYIRDLYRRILAWFATYVPPAAAAAGGGA